MQVFLEYCKMFFINAPNRTNKSKLYLFPSKPCFLPLLSRILLCTRLCIFFCKALNRDILNRIELSDKHSLENRFRLTIVEKIMIWQRWLIKHILNHAIDQTILYLKLVVLYRGDFELPSIYKISLEKYLFPFV